MDAQIVSRVAGQALEGRIQQQRLWFELQGKIRGASDVAQAGNQTTIGAAFVFQSLIPRPGDPGPGDKP